MKCKYVIILCAVGLMVLSGCKKATGYEDVWIGSIVVNPQIIYEKEIATITVSLINLGQEIAIIESVPTWGITNPCITETNGSNVSIEYISGMLPQGTSERIVLVKIRVRDVYGNMLDNAEVKLIVETLIEDDPADVDTRPAISEGKTL